jgi:predicted anti-sigma-YlaC factor YlaD
MNCAGSQELWQRRLDGEPIPTVDAAELELHLAACRSCRALHGLAGVLSGPHLVFDRSAPPVGLADRVVAGIQGYRRARQRHVWATAALAASILVAGFTYVAVHSFHGSNANGDLVQQTPPTQPPQPQPTTDTAALDHTVQDAGFALMALTRRTAHETLEGTRLLLPDVSSPESVADPVLFQRTLETPAESFRQASSGLSTGLEPVTASARRAVQMFWEDVSPSARGL